MIVGVLCIIVEHLPHNENRKTVAVATELLRLLQMCQLIGPPKKIKSKKKQTVGSSLKSKNIGVYLKKGREYMRVRRLSHELPFMLTVFTVWGSSMSY